MPAAWIIGGVLAVLVLGFVLTKFGWAAEPSRRDAGAARFASASPRAAERGATPTARAGSRTPGR